MDKINPNSYITDTDPTVEAVMDTSGWYETEYAYFFTNSEQLPWYIAQGWIYYGPAAYVNGGEYISIYSRRTLKPELALADLVTSFTNAYNEGRQLNDQRYDEILAIYTVMLDKTEDDLNSLESDATDYDDLIEDLITALGSDYDALRTSVNANYGNYMDAARERIETAFDNKLIAERASLIARGIYNTTTYDSISAGIERDKQIALNELEDKLADRAISVEDRMYVLKTDMRAKILAARDRLRDTLHNSDERRIGLRNTIVQAMLSFMERREDGYPDISSIGQLAGSLGFGESTMVRP